MPTMNLSLLFFMIFVTSSIGHNGDDPDLEDACKAVGKKHDCTGMLNMQTCKAKCIDDKGRVSFEGVTDGVKCMCISHSGLYILLS